MFRRAHDSSFTSWRSQRTYLTAMLRVRDGRGREMCLLTSVLDHTQLSDDAMCEIYRRRWGIEICYRELKQTLGHRKLASAKACYDSR